MKLRNYRPSSVDSPRATGQVILVGAMNILRDSQINLTCAVRLRWHDRSVLSSTQLKPCSHCTAGYVRYIIYIYNALVGFDIQAGCTIAIAIHTHMDALLHAFAHIHTN